MAMVSNKFLGSLAARLGLHTHLQYFSTPLQGAITRYVEESQLAFEVNQSVDFWLATEDPPKVRTWTFQLGLPLVKRIWCMIALAN